MKRNIKIKKKYYRGKSVFYYNNIIDIVKNCNNKCLPLRLTFCTDIKWYININNTIETKFNRIRMLQLRKYFKTPKLINK